MQWNLSFLGLAEYDPTLFDEFQVPDGINKQSVTDALCLETSGLSVIYPAADALKTALGIFSARRLDAWTRAYNALKTSYNILDSDDYTDTETRNTNSTRNPNLSRTVNTTRSPDLTASGQNGGTDTTTNQVAAFNGNMLADRERTTTQLGTTNTVHTTGTETTDSTEQQTGSDTTTGNETVERTRTGYAGVDPQSRIEAELALCKNTIIDMIVQDVKCNFCVMVY